MYRAFLGSICLASLTVGLIGCSAPDVPEDPDSAISYALWKLPHNEPIPASIPVGRRVRVAVYDDLGSMYDPQYALLIRILKENPAIDVGPAIDIVRMFPPNFSSQNDPDHEPGAYFLSQACDRAKQLDCDFVLLYARQGSAGLALGAHAAAEDDGRKEDMVLVDALTHRPVNACTQTLSTFVVFPLTGKPAIGSEGSDNSEMRTLRLLIWEITRPLAETPLPTTTVPSTHS